MEHIGTILGRMIAQGLSGAEAWGKPPATAARRASTAAERVLTRSEERRGQGPHARTAAAEPEGRSAAAAGRSAERHQGASSGESPGSAPHPLTGGAASEPLVGELPSETIKILRKIENSAPGHSHAVSNYPRFRIFANRMGPCRITER